MKDKHTSKKQKKSFFGTKTMHLPKSINPFLCCVFDTIGGRNFHEIMAPGHGHSAHCVCSTRRIPTGRDVESLQLCRMVSWCSQANQSAMAIRPRCKHNALVHHQSSTIHMRIKLCATSWQTVDHTTVTPQPGGSTQERQHVKRWVFSATNLTQFTKLRWTNQVFLMSSFWNTQSCVQGKRKTPST